MTRRSTTSTSGLTRSLEEKPGDVVFPDQEELQLGSGTRRRSSGTCTASTRTSRTSTSPIRRCATRSPRSSATGSRQGLAGFRVDAVPFLLEPMGTPEGAIERSARPAARAAPLHGAAPRRRDPDGRGQPAARRAARVLRRRGRRRAAHGPELQRSTRRCTSRSRAARRSRSVRRPALRSPEIPQDSQWANFVRNHDELTLDKLAD